MKREGERNFKLILEYDGSNYHGWQRQAGLLTVQEVVESCLGIMLGRKVTIRASGRTDAGVHALGQVINFYAKTRLNPEDFQRGLNSLLPDDIVVKSAEEVDVSFHARFSALKKIYCYRILNRSLPSVFIRRYAWHVPYTLNLEAMERALEYIKGEHDFSAFMASKSSVKSFVRHIYRANLKRIDNENLLLILEANGFLRHMVRIIAGTIVEIGIGKKSFEEMPEIIKSRDRNRAGITAPAHGLYLVRVIYNSEDEISDKDILRHLIRALSFIDS